MQTLVADHRKYCIWRILAPYLINVKELSEMQASNIIKDWLDKCNQLKRLDFNPSQKIKKGLDSATRGYYPLGLEKLKIENIELYAKFAKLHER